MRVADMTQEFSPTHPNPPPFIPQFRPYPMFRRRQSRRLNTTPANQPTKRTSPQRKASNSRSTSRRRAAGPPVVIRRQAVALTQQKHFSGASRRSFQPQGPFVSKWSHSVANPFDEDGFKIPDLIAGPPSVLLPTKDITNTYHKHAWVQAATDSSGLSQFDSTINTTGQQLIVQFLPCVMAPGSFIVNPEELAHAGFTDNVTFMLSKLLENSKDKITPVLGWWMLLNATGTIMGVDVLRADKMMTAEEAVKLMRLTKAGIKVGLQQPKLTTGGQVYINKGPGAYIPLYAFHNFNEANALGSTEWERLPTFRPGDQCNVTLDDAGLGIGASNTPATKANMVRLCSKTAGTVMKALDRGPEHGFKVASYPLDSVKALEYMPYSNADSWNLPSNVDGSPPVAPLLGHIDGTLGQQVTTASTGVGYSADRVKTNWCPAWFVFHPTFTTSINPHTIIANLQIETYTAWEFVPYPRTFAHLTRTPAIKGKASDRETGHTRDSTSGQTGLEAQDAERQKKGGGGGKRR